MPCAFCGATLSMLPRRPNSTHRRPTKDHLWPKSRFIQYSIRNYHYSSLAYMSPLLDACSVCNTEKGNLTAREWLATMSIADARWPRVAEVAAEYPVPPPHHRWKPKTAEFEADRWNEIKLHEGIYR